MTKEELLVELSQKISAGEITREEIVRVAQLDASRLSSDIALEKHFSLSKMLYVIGAIIVVIGIVVLIARVWDDIGAFGHILITLVLGLVIMLSGSFILLKGAKEQENIGQILHTVGGILVPGGAVVVVNEMLPKIDSLWPYTITMLFVFVFFLILNLIHKNAVLTFFATACGTITVYMTTFALLEDVRLTYEDEIYAYLTMVVGIVYVVLGKSFRGGWNEKLISIYNFAGVAAFYGAAFSQLFDSIIWQLIYIPLLLGGFVLSVFERSKGILVVTTIAVLSYLAYITSEYFADSIGWPISLVVLGFMFIGLGYASITINKKFITN